MNLVEEMEDIYNRQIRQHNDLRMEMKRNDERIKRLIKFADNTPAYLEALNREFEEETELNSREISIMFIVIGLQLLRQHFFTRFPQRLDDQTSAKNTPGHSKEHSDIHQWYYNPTLDEIISCPVPFDANIGANGALSGGGKLGHRVTALGHDPVLGLVVGTCNIATSTLTNCRFESYHIRTSGGRDAFSERAQTALVFQKTFEKLFYKGIEGKQKVGAAFIKELIHLKSDVDTTNSLPLPLISVINPRFASELAEYGMDFSNAITILKQVTYARLINSFAAMYHYSFYDGKTSKDIYRVKTKKIICYSNIVASGINIAEVFLTEDYDLLDIGGIANTIFEVITSTKFIKKVKRDFIFGRYDEALAAL